MIPKFAWPPAKGVSEPRHQSPILVTVPFGYWTPGTGVQKDTIYRVLRRRSRPPVQSLAALGFLRFFAFCHRPDNSPKTDMHYNPLSEPKQTPNRPEIRLGFQLACSSKDLSPEIKLAGLGRWLDCLGVAAVSEQY